MKKLLLMIVISLGMSLQAAEILDAQRAVDVAGKQRMLSQRMLVDYVMIGMHSNFKNPKKDLALVLNEFEENLKAITKYGSAAKIQTALKKVQKTWKDAKKILTSKVDKQQCETLSTVLDRLLAASNKVVIEIKRDAAASHGEIVDISGRQRMLSQRIAGLYLMDLWLQNDASKRALKDAMRSYENAFLKLQAFEKNTESISQYLGQAEKAYLYIKNMKGVGLPMDHMPAIIYKKANDIFANMDKATHLYADIMEKVARD